MLDRILLGVLAALITIPESSSEVHTTMIHKPIIFLSSTMRNLRDVRDALNQTLLDRGFGTVVAEINATIPHDDEDSIKRTCLANVESSDILVLILGADFGSRLDGEWLVKSEFYHARQKRKPVYAFVQHDAFHSFELAAKHPDDDSRKLFGIDPEVVEF